MLYARRTFSYEHEPQKCDVSLLGIPFDSTETGFPVRFGPLFLREAIRSIPGYDPESETNIFKKLRFFDAGDVETVPGSWKLTSEAIKDTVRSLQEAGPESVKAFLGGEHLITLAVLETLGEFHKKITVIHFDAHRDLMPDWMGERFSHITWAHHAAKRPGIELVQIGCRSWHPEEEGFLKSLGVKENIHETDNPLYITVDLDVFDPSHAPEVGTPEPGGLSPREFLNHLNAIPMKRLIGFDIVECASQSVNTRTANLGAWVFRKILSLMVKE